MSWPSLGRTRNQLRQGPNYNKPASLLYLPVRVNSSRVQHSAGLSGPTQQADIRPSNIRRCIRDQLDPGHKRLPFHSRGDRRRKSAKEKPLEPGGSSRGLVQDRGRGTGEGAALGNVEWNVKRAVWGVGLGGSVVLSRTYYPVRDPALFPTLHASN